jgi:ABC-2 type transport system ATP-binding protein
MPGFDKWWRAWAPFWEHLENTHFAIREIEMVLPGLSDPILIVGAGQGLIVEHLRKKGYRADGVDLEREMIIAAKKRRSLDFIRADALALPFRTGSYQTVVIASGVVDYIDDDDVAIRIIEEAKRLVAPFGNLITAFYQLNPIVEKVYKKMGVVVEDQGYYLGRIFKILSLLRENPLKCVKPISGWTKKSYPIAFLYWTKLGLTLPKELKEEQNKVDAAVDAALKQGVSKDALFGSVPKLVPYRKIPEAESLLDKAGFPVYRFELTDECLVACCRALPLKKIKYASDPENGEYAIRASNLTKIYKTSRRAAVSSLSLKIRKGSIHGILGPNGAGKTTTLSMLCGLMEPTDGTVSYSARIETKGLKRAIGYVPQEIAVYDALSGRDNLKFFGNLYGVTGAKLRGKTEEILGLVGLEGRADDLVSRYSNGMKRRLNLAAGLIHGPEIIFLDEPTVGVDPQSRNRIFEMIKHQNELGATIIYTTHYMDEASRLCGVVSIMDNGKVILEGSPKELVERFGLYTIEMEAPQSRRDMVNELKKIESVAEASISNERLTIKADGRLNEMELFEQIKNIYETHGCSMSLKSITEPDLESLFLDFTGRGLRDESQIA